MRGARSRARGQRVHLGGHDEVVLVQPLDLVRVEDDAAVAPTEADVGVMAFPLGDLGDLLDHGQGGREVGGREGALDRKSTRLNSSHVEISYAVFCLKKKK